MVGTSLPKRFDLQVEIENRVPLLCRAPMGEIFAYENILGSTSCAVVLFKYESSVFYGSQMIIYFKQTT